MSAKKENWKYSRFHRRTLFCSAAALVLAVTPAAKAQSRFASKADFCSKLGKTFQASMGAQMYCFGPQPNGRSPQVQQTTTTGRGLANVDAATLSEDRTGSGAYIGGQSETSIAASGEYVVEAWNDATGIFAGCGSVKYSEELTGYGFSRNGGRSFTDMGGLPNVNCGNGSRWHGDPSVGVYTHSGSTFFYISSLYACSTADGCPNGGVAVGLSACMVTARTLSCGQPIVAATGNCNGASASSCFPIVDKDYLTVDRKNKRLYIAYTDFTSGNDIDLASCDLGSDPKNPVCSNGTSFGQAYVTAQRTDTTYGCEQEGAYPAVRESTGDVYVSDEYNWYTNFAGNSNCVNTQPTLVVVTDVPFSCLPDPITGTSACAGPFNDNANIIVSVDAASIPGYNRFPMNDFPRIAVSEPYNTVSLVWNDARNTPLGDILLQSYDLDTLNYIQGSPVRLNSDDSFADMHILPGLKNTSRDGKINVTWYDRRGRNAGTGKTDVYAALNVNPETSRSPGSNLRITNQSTDWLVTSSNIVPNFGDYTDNFVSSSNMLFVTWSDGRSGVPQPYEAHLRVH